MAELGPAAWPPAPIRTDRLVLRESEARDRAAVIDLFSAPEVGTYIGGSQPRAELERTVPETPGRRPGFFVADLDGAMIGMITLDRRDAERRGHVRPDGGGRAGLPVPAAGMGTRLCRRGVRSGTGLVRRRASR
jgi:RimJ/RimL family protein N-acetyltransferase